MSLYICILKALLPEFSFSPEVGVAEEVYGQLQRLQSEVTALVTRCGHVALEKRK